MITDLLNSSATISAISRPLTKRISILQPTSNISNTNRSFARPESHRSSRAVLPQCPRLLISVWATRVGLDNETLCVPVQTTAACCSLCVVLGRNGNARPTAAKNTTLAVQTPPYASVTTATQSWQRVTFYDPRPTWPISQSTRDPRDPWPVTHDYSPHQSLSQCDVCVP